GTDLLKSRQTLALVCHSRSRVVAIGTWPATRQPVIDRVPQGKNGPGQAVRASFDPGPRPEKDGLSCPQTPTTPFRSIRAIRGKRSEEHTSELQSRFD